MEQIIFQTENFNRENFHIDDEKYELYDRNIRLWGKENQVKLTNSNVLLINLNCAVTELAKNLLLAGINLYLHDKNQIGDNIKVTQSEINSNYFLNSAHIGMDRIKVLKDCLEGINVYASIKELNNFEKLDDIQCVCVGFTSFEKLNFYEDYFSKNNLPFYCINTSGMFAFFYNNLGHNFPIYHNNNCGSNQVSKDHVNKYNTNPSEDPLQNFSKKSHIYFENLKRLQTNSSKKKIIRNNLFTAVCILQSYELQFPGEEKNFKKFLTFGNDYLKENNLDFLCSYDQFQKILKKLIKNYNVEFNSICSIIGGIVSQEVQKVLTQEEVFQNLYCYDSEQQAGNFVDLINIF